MLENVFPLVFYLGKRPQFLEFMYFYFLPRLYVLLINSSAFIAQFLFLLEKNLETLKKQFY